MQSAPRRASLDFDRDRWLNEYDPRLGDYDPRPDDELARGLALGVAVSFAFAGGARPPAALPSPQSFLLACD